MDQTNRDIQQSQKSIYAEQGNVYVTYAGERRIPHALTPPFSHRNLSWAPG